MVCVKGNDDVKMIKASKRKLFITSLIGATFLLIPIIFEFFDPFLYVAKYRFRIDNGSTVNDLLLRRLESVKLSMYLFNITNAEEFLSGKHEKLKLEEIGPFAFQEYRINEDLEINKEPGIMRYTPRLQAVFIPEESCGRLEDYQHLILPNLSMLSATAMLSKYPYFIKQIFNMLASSSHSKAFIKTNAYDYFWGFPDPLINLANTVVPGLIYFKSVGLMERFFDVDANYRIELGTSDSEKFQVKKVTRFHLNKKDNSKDLVDNIHYYNNSYEGAAFPPNMDPELPFNIQRHGICKTFGFQPEGFRDMEYGGRANVYRTYNSTFNDHELCNSKGWCPEGLLNMAPCFFDGVSSLRPCGLQEEFLFPAYSGSFTSQPVFRYPPPGTRPLTIEAILRDKEIYLGLPLALSKGHFLDSDPRIIDRLEGIKPDRKVDDAELVLDLKIGVAIEGHMSLQLNIFLADVGYNSETKRLKDMVLPVVNVMVRQPRMLDEVKDALFLLYTQGPYILLAVQIIFVLLGLGLLAYTAKMMYRNREAKKRSFDGTTENKERLIKSLATVL